MNMNKSTRYALYAAMEMAREECGGTTPVKQIAQRYGISESVLAKTIQQLVRAGLATGTRGAGGGYRLVREPSRITVLDILNAFEPPRPPGRCLLAETDDEVCGDATVCRLKSLFDEVDEQARATFASVTLETLVGRSGRSRAPRLIVGGGRGTPR